MTLTETFTLLLESSPNPGIMQAQHDESNQFTPLGSGSSLIFYYDVHVDAGRYLGRHLV